MRRAARALGVLLCLVALGWVALVAAVYLYGRRSELRPADVVVVFGAAQYNGRPSPVFRARLDHAAVLYRRSYAPVVLVTGGFGRGDTISEADAGARYLTRRGVPSQAILRDPVSRHSAASVRAVRRIMQRHGLRSALLVSDPFHMLRLRLLAWQVGVRAYSAPTPSSVVTRNPWREWRFVLKESWIIPPSLLLGWLERWFAPA
jgi:uncharacterized SAM-binding protein YcdF (DUF218 family)